MQNYLCLKLDNNFSSKGCCYYYYYYLVNNIIYDSIKQYELLKTISFNVNINFCFVYNYYLFINVKGMFILQFYVFNYYTIAYITSIVYQSSFFPLFRKTPHTEPPFTYSFFAVYICTSRFLFSQSVSALETKLIVT